MAYASVNFKTKKALKEALADGKKIRVYSHGPFGCQQEGNITLEGPHYQTPHTWYAQAKVAEGYIIPGSVK